MFADRFVDGLLAGALLAFLGVTAFFVGVGLVAIAESA